MRKYKALTALLFVAAFVCGCGASGPVFKTGTLAGTAKIDDRPFDADAVLMFLDNTSGQAYTAPVETDGKFTVEEKVRVGTYTVYLAPKPQAPDDPEMQPTGVTMDTSMPDKYWNEATSDLKVTVKEGENTPTIVFKKG
ncbi:peptidase associated/transthyretin-like domain-containing protein [Gimesia fumaroli]|jgi:hypothetical protein|uniref:Carboxypeptidase regulatory-like domain-containing protein n=1 Tax=Gimesia fumaroli TaxID=2527976 RepID=A0A518I858_9PLAN|nr:carboxypeptidase regulatory-like domain-containing protein [Gimesia fumaroli]QDV49287.1 hypothetical protein Enr17x_13040 [Gimesia fumaroli]